MTTLDMSIFPLSEIATHGPWMTLLFLTAISLSVTMFYFRSRGGKTMSLVSLPCTIVHCLLETLNRGREGVSSID